jgi:hypothetical protein
METVPLAIIIADHAFTRYVGSKYMASKEHFTLSGKVLELEALEGYHGYKRKGM